MGKNNKMGSQHQVLSAHSSLFLEHIKKLWQHVVPPDEELPSAVASQGGALLAGAVSPDAAVLPREDAAAPRRKLSDDDARPAAYPTAEAEFRSGEEPRQR